jgi:transcriptional regulator with GAF, ATPase, and Fis domain
MAREDRLVDAFVTLADTLIDNYDIIEFLQTLAERCVDLVDVAAAGIMLADTKGELRHAACSDEQMRFVELLELQYEEGPCLDAYRTHERVTCASPELLAQRWPRFGPLAAEHGFESVSAVPMRLRDRVIGALNLFSKTPLGLSDQDLRVVQAMADVATIGILQERSLHDAHAFSAQLEVALESRVVIEQAKGVVAERSDIDVDTAFERIRGFARSHNRLLSETAREIVSGSLAADALLAAAGQTKHPPHSE